MITLGPTGTRYGAKLGIQWDTSKVRANLRSLADKYPEEMGRVLREEGVAIMDESMRVCPVDKENTHEDGTPHLVDTGQVSGPYREGSESVIILSYDTPYAVLQHEVQEYHHDFPEQWKYLEHPMNERAKYMPANLAKGVDLERMMEGYQAESMVDIFQRTVIQNVYKEEARAKQKAINKYGSLMGQYSGRL